MAQRVQVRVIVELVLDDPGAVSDAACRMYAEMDTEPPGGLLSPGLEHDLREQPGLALQALIDPRRLMTGVWGITFVRAQTLVGPHEADGSNQPTDLDDFHGELQFTRLRARGFVGLTAEEARQRAYDLGFALRTWKNDDPDATGDWNPRRITAYVEGGTVISADAG